VGGLIRAVEAAGGFATVLSKGDADFGTLLVVLIENGENARVFERIPDASGTQKWTMLTRQNIGKKSEFLDYLTRRTARDRDLWIIELDIARGERFIGLTAPLG